MKSSNWGVTLRKYARFLHRDLSYFLAGIIIIYAVSGIALNHRSSFNPDYSIEVIEQQLDQPLPAQTEITKADVVKILAQFDADGNYTKHYFPQTGIMKVFLKGGSNLMVDLNDNHLVYEKLTRRPLLSAFTRLHYNPGRWWTYFSDFFAVGLLIITFSGIVMIKGKKGLWGRGGIELLLGILIPILFLFG